MQNQQTPRPVRIDAIVKKTNCYNFINILLYSGYQYINKGNDKQLQFDSSHINELLAIFEEVIEYNDKLSAIINTNSSQKRRKNKSRGTIKLGSVLNKSNNDNNNNNNNHHKSKSKMKSIIHHVPYKLGSYRLQKMIGKGSYGTVYLCTDETLKVYAMKLFNKTAVNETEMESIISEIEILSSLPTHYNLIELVEVVENDKYIGIVLPYFESGSLSSFIRDFGLDMISEELVISLITQILKGIEFIHKHGIIHRDIKAVKSVIFIN